MAHDHLSRDYGQHLVEEVLNGRITRRELLVRASVKSSEFPQALPGLCLRHAASGTSTSTTASPAASLPDLWRAPSQDNSSSHLVRGTASWPPPRTPGVAASEHPHSGLVGKAARCSSGACAANESPRGSGGMVDASLLKRRWGSHKRTLGELLMATHDASDR